MPKKVYKDIPGYEGIYGISQNGEIISYARIKKGMNNSISRNPERILKQTGKNQKRYHGVSLAKDGISIRKQVHRLVYTTFIGNIPKGKQINHIDGNKLNNNLSNLELCTPKQNIRHAWKTGLARKTRENTYSKLKIEEVKRIRILAKQGLYHREIAKMFNVSRQHITAIINDKHWVKNYK